MDLDNSLGGVTGGPVLWVRGGFQNAVSKTGMVGGGGTKEDGDPLTGGGNWGGPNLGGAPWVLHSQNPGGAFPVP